MITVIESFCHFNSLDQIGIPLLFLGLLIKNRSSLKSSTTTVFLGFLFLGYSDRVWFFETVNIKINHISLISYPRLDRPRREAVSDLCPRVLPVECTNDCWPHCCVLLRLPNPVVL